MLRLLVKVFLRLCFRYEIRGEIPRTRPEKLLILANHQSLVDPLFLLAHCPFEITWVTHAQIVQRWYFRACLRWVDHLVVDTANPLALKHVLEAVNAGKVVCLFPEGRITVTGGLMKVYDGMSFLHFKTGAPILPVNFEGPVHSLFTRLTKPFPWKLRPRVRVTFFPLRSLDAPAGRTARERRRRANHQVRRLLEENWFRAEPEGTLFEAFLRAVELYGRGRQMVEDIRFEPVSFGGLLKGALALGRLISRYAAEGEAVGVLMPNAAPTLMLLFGLFGSRRVPAMLNYTAGVDGMQSACRLARVKVIVTSRTFLERAKLKDKAAQLRDVKLIFLEDLRAGFSLADKLWLVGYALRFPHRALARVRPEDPAIILFTSGSEGKPKGVVLSHRGILANVAQARSVIEFSVKDKFLAALPLFHSFGLMIGALVPLTAGARVFLYPSPLHFRMVPEMAYDRDCTVIAGTGTFLARYARLAHEYDFYNVRYAVCGAEKLPEPARQLWMEKFGIRIIEGYGTTEMSPVISINTPTFTRLGTVGRIVPGIDYHIEPVEGIPAGGVLHVRGPNQMLGYLRDDAPGVIQPPRSSRGDGWYDTGDVVEIDDDGYLKIVGRVKRFAKVAGEMVSLEVVETIAAAASPNRAHGATLFASERRGEVVVLYTEDPALRREQLLEAARALGYPEVAVARIVVPVERLPRLGSGKCDYVKLKELAAELGRRTEGSG